MPLMSGSISRLLAHVLLRLVARLNRSNLEPYVVPYERRINRAAMDAIAEKWRRRGAKIGNNVRITQDIDHINPHLVTIGDRCVIGGFVLAHGPGTKIGPVTIGDEVYIGWNALVLPCVAIGSGSFIGAGAVVTKNIPENSVAVGNPARVIRAVTFDERRLFVEAMIDDRFIGALPWHQND